MYIIEVVFFRAHGDKTMLPTVEDTELLNALGKTAALSDDEEDEESDNEIADGESGADATAMAGLSICDDVENEGAAAHISPGGSASEIASHRQDIEVEEKQDSEEEALGDTGDEAAALELTNPQGKLSMYC